MFRSLSRSKEFTFKAIKTNFVLVSGIDSAFIFGLKFTLKKYIIVLVNKKKNFLNHVYKFSLIF